MMLAEECTDVENFLRESSKIGQDWFLVQDTGGNTSVKTTIKDFNTCSRRTTTYVLH